MSDIVEKAATPLPAAVTGLAGFAAAFGVASCCALPFFLSMAGLSVGWVTAIAAWSSPWRIALVVISAVLLLAAAVMALRIRPGASAAWLRWAILGGTGAGAALLLLGIVYA